MRRRPLFLALLAAGVAGCGSAEATPTCAPEATPSAPVVRAAAITATASAGSVAPGASIDFKVAVHGPISFMTDCSSPLDLTIVDGGGVSVDTTTATTAEPAPQCGTVTLTAVQTVTYRARWTPDPTLPSGTYTVSLVLGDQPPLTLAVPVRTFNGGC